MIVIDLGQYKIKQLVVGNPLYKTCTTYPKIISRLYRKLKIRSLNQGQEHNLLKQIKTTKVQFNNQQM